MHPKEKAVRDAAAALATAIAEAQAAGFRVIWPHRPEDLPGIAISETGAVTPPPPEAPRPTFARPAAAGGGE